MEKEEQFTIKDLYKEFWECRNFEIDHLWQRSVFLAVFMLAIATGYGTFVNTYIAKVNCGIHQNMFHVICLSLCVLGIQFSQLWIMMAKGSKRWYEKFETAISTFYQDIENKNIGNRNSDFELFEKELKDLICRKEIPYFGNISDKNIDDSLLSTDGGNFSVSRINIFIGQLTCFVWIALACIHSVNLMPNMNCKLLCLKIAISIICVVAFTIFSKLFISRFFTHSEY